jgi:glycine/D-amino acid oxidase-like deaminating enzyme
VPGWTNAFVATGHGANGLLQGPYSSRLLASAITGTPGGPDEAALPEGFDPARFA